MQWTGIPVLWIGIGPNALAELVNHCAQTAERKPGIYPQRVRQAPGYTTCRDELVVVQG